MNQSPSYEEVLHFLTTPKGRMLGAIVYESEGLSLEGLKNYRERLTDPHLIRLADALIRYKERTA